MQIVKNHHLIKIFTNVQNLSDLVINDLEHCLERYLGLEVSPLVNKRPFNLLL